MPFPLLLIPIGLVAAAVIKSVLSDNDSSNSSSSSSSSSSSGEYNGSYDDYPCGDSYSGRWTQNELNIRDNIAMGMAVKED